LIRVPVCWFFGVSLGWGLKGVGMGAPAASFVVLLVIAGYMVSGKWKHNAVTAQPTPRFSGEA
jgi:Na+-driven multidrug efflux pump